MTTPSSSSSAPAASDARAAGCAGGSGEAAFCLPDEPPSPHTPEQSARVQESCTRRCVQGPPIYSDSPEQRIKVQRCRDRALYTRLLYLRPKPSLTLCSTMPLLSFDSRERALSGALGVEHVPTALPVGDVCCRYDNGSAWVAEWKTSLDLARSIIDGRIPESRAQSLRAPEPRAPEPQRPLG